MGGGVGGAADPDNHALRLDRLQGVGLPGGRDDPVVHRGHCQAQRGDTGRIKYTNSIVSGRKSAMGFKSDLHYRSQLYKFLIYCL